jgi:hypothetical protein
MSLPSCSPTKTLYALLSPIHATCFTHLILRDLITRVIFIKRCNSFRYAVFCTPCYVFHLVLY